MKQQAMFDLFRNQAPNSAPLVMWSISVRGYYMSCLFREYYTEHACNGEKLLSRLGICILGKCSYRSVSIYSYLNEIPSFIFIGL